ncbi:MAG TPA: response regulator [Candidatus Binatia bacterium]|nr:response regulator [Candidatus Binatia bacterium]
MRPERVVSVVDDDESIRQALEGLLRSVGLQVAAFASAEEFLGSEAPWSTGCLVLDLSMPGMDGLQLQRRLARDGHRMPIIIVSAHDGEEARARALGAGAAGFLRKPFDGALLLSAVESALADTDGTTNWSTREA